MKKPDLSRLGKGRRKDAAGDAIKPPPATTREGMPAAESAVDAGAPRPPFRRRFAGLLGRDWRQAMGHPLVVGLAALLALQVTTARYTGRGLGLDPADADAALLNFDPARVRVIHIEGAGEGDDLTLVRGAHGWVLADLDGFPVDNERVQRLFTTLNDLRRPLPIATSAEARDRFRVSDRRFERRITLGGADGVLATLLVGESAGFRRVYVRAAGDNAVYDVTLPLFDLSNRDNDWLDRDRLRVNPERINHLASADWSLVRGAEGWQLEGAADSPDPAAVNGLLQQVANLRYRGVLGHDEPVTLDPTADPFTLDIGLADGTKRRYRLATTVSGDYVLSDPASAHRYRLAAYDVDGLPRIDTTTLTNPPAELLTAAAIAAAAEVAATEAWRSTAEPATEDADAPAVTRVQDGAATPTLADLLALDETGDTAADAADAPQEVIADASAAAAAALPAGDRFAEHEGPWEAASAEEAPGGEAPAAAPAADDLTRRAEPAVARAVPMPGDADASSPAPTAVAETAMGDDQAAPSAATHNHRHRREPPTVADSPLAAGAVNEHQHRRPHPAPTPTDSPLAAAPHNEHQQRGRQRESAAAAATADFEAFVDRRPADRAPLGPSPQEIAKDFERFTDRRPEERIADALSQTAVAPPASRPGPGADVTRGTVDSAAADAELPTFLGPDEPAPLAADGPAAEEMAPGQIEPDQRRPQPPRVATVPLDAPPQGQTSPGWTPAPEQASPPASDQATRDAAVPAGDADDASGPSTPVRAARERPEHWVDVKKIPHARWSPPDPATDSRTGADSQAARQGQAAGERMLAQAPSGAEEIPADPSATGRLDAPTDRDDDPIDQDRSPAERAAAEVPPPAPAVAARGREGWIKKYGVPAPWWLPPGHVPADADSQDGTTETGTAAAPPARPRQYEAYDQDEIPPRAYRQQTPPPATAPVPRPQPGARSDPAAAAPARELPRPAQRRPEPPRQLPPAASAVPSAPSRASGPDTAADALPPSDPRLPGTDVAGRPADAPIAEPMTARPVRPFSGPTPERTPAQEAPAQPSTPPTAPAQPTAAAVDDSPVNAAIAAASAAAAAAAAAAEAATVAAQAAQAAASAVTSVAAGLAAPERESVPERLPEPAPAAGEPEPPPATPGSDASVLPTPRPQSQPQFQRQLAPQPLPAPLPTPVRPETSRDVDWDWARPTRPAPGTGERPLAGERPDQRGLTDAPGAAPAPDRGLAVPPPRVPERVPDEAWSRVPDPAPMRDLEREPVRAPEPAPEPTPMRAPERAALPPPVAAATPPAQVNLPIPRAPAGNVREFEHFMYDMLFGAAEVDSTASGPDAARAFELKMFQPPLRGPVRPRGWEQ